MGRTRPKGERDPGWVRISWDEAMALVASRLLDIKAQYGPEAVVFGCATPAGTAAADFCAWVQRLANAFGSPNVLSANHICDWHSGGSAQYTYGVSMPQPDYDQARCILLWGYNPQASQPADAMRISRAKARGAKLIVIDPRKASMVDKADLWLRVRPGSDGALALAMIHVLLEEALYDAPFVRDVDERRPSWSGRTPSSCSRSRTSPRRGTRRPSSPGTAEAAAPWPIAPTAGMRRTAWSPRSRARIPSPSPMGQRCTCRPALALLKELAAQYAPERSEAITWVPAADVRRAVRLFATEQPVMLLHLGRARRAHQCHADQPGCVPLLRPHRPVRSARQQRALRQHPHQSHRGARAAAQGAGSPHASAMPSAPWGRQAPAGHVTAYDMYRAILTGQPYPVKALVTFGTDPLMGNGDPLQGKAALEALDFYVHVDLVRQSQRLPGRPAPARLHLLGARGPQALLGRRGGASATWAQFREPVVQPLHESAV